MDRPNFHLRTSMSDSGNSGSDGVQSSLTAPALAEIIELRAGEAAPESLACASRSSGAHDDVYTYDMYFQATSDAVPATGSTISTVSR